MDFEPTFGELVVFTVIGMLFGIFALHSAKQFRTGYEKMKVKLGVCTLSPFSSLVYVTFRSWT